MLLITAGYVARRHQRSGWRVRAQQDQWALLQAVRSQANSLQSQAATLQTLTTNMQYRGRGRGRGRNRSHGRGRGGR